MNEQHKPGYCRLAVILASEAPKGVILRRGPSNWVQLILWDTATDTFTEGQWFRGRIYEDRCDLSPDGSKFVYFAAKHHTWQTHAPTYAATWTAISKPPYFTALALWNWFGTYGGGGYFIDNNTVCVRTYEDPHQNHQPPATLRIDTVECTLAHQPVVWRMLQNGWTEHYKSPRLRRKYPEIVTFSKDNPDKAYTLTMDFHGYNYNPKTQYGDSLLITCSVKRNSDGTEFIVSDAWADWDQQGRLIYIDKGQLYSGGLNDNDIVPKLLMDFNPNTRKPIKAPEWATVW